MKKFFFILCLSLTACCHQQGIKTKTPEINHSRDSSFQITTNASNEPLAHTQHRLNAISPAY